MGQSGASSRSRPVFLSTAALLIPLCLVGCAKPAQDRPPDKPAPSQQELKQEEGLVRILEASREFIEVQEVSGARTDAAISAPARVDFRDGAVSQVGAPLEGRVVAVQVRVGQAVAVGDPLLTLDCPDAAAMRAAVDTATAALRDARAELERQLRMQREGVGIERDRITAETRVSTAEAEVSKVAADAMFIGAGAGASVVVRSPISGIVITRKATSGMAVQRGGDPLVEVGDASALWVVADVFERDLAHIREGATASIDLPSVEGHLTGRVASIGTIVATGLRTAPVRLTVDVHGRTLKPGMYGRVQIDTSDSGITLPSEAVLIKDGKDSIVYIQRDPLSFERRRVVVGQPVEGRVQIMSGVSPGDKVVVRGALLLDGSADQLL